MLSSRGINMRATLIKLFADGSKSLYRGGDIILHANRAHDKVHFIVSGWVKIYQVDWQYGDKILSTLVPGDIFPCTWNTTSNSKGVNFGALDDTQTLSIPFTRFQQEIAKHPQYARELLDIVSQQLNTFADEITNLQYRNAREKVILRLISLAKTFGHAEENGKVVIHKHIPNEYIARSTSMSRETTSREMSRLVRERLIRHTNTTISIPNIAKLQHQVTDHGPAIHHKHSIVNKPTQRYAIKERAM